MRVARGRLAAMGHLAHPMLLGDLIDYMGVQAPVQGGRREEDRPWSSKFAAVRWKLDAPLLDVLAQQLDHGPRHGVAEGDEGHLQQQGVRVRNESARQVEPGGVRGRERGHPVGPAVRVEHPALLLVLHGLVQGGEHVAAESAPLAYPAHAGVAGALGQVLVEDDIAQYCAVEVVDTLADVQHPHVRRHEDIAGLWDEYLRHELEDGGLALVLGADEGVQLALRKLGAHLLQQRDARGVAEADIVQLYGNGVDGEDGYALVRDHDALLRGVIALAESTMG
mmetsp:Transcript_28997/g.73595  ORF Transcript_28997/g.73595 Transcript_28997/m.73595 type:complete len:280 (-) Transcript_28997:1731-2570(-)